MKYFVNNRNNIIVLLTIQAVLLCVVFPSMLLANELVFDSRMEYNVWIANDINPPKVNERSADQFRSGGKYSRLINTQRNIEGAQGIKQRIDLVDGAEYLVSAWIYPKVNGQYYVGLSNGQLEDAVELSAFVWQEITNTVTYTGGSDGVYIVSWDSPNTVFYVDDVSVEEIIDGVPQGELVFNSRMEQNEWIGYARRPLNVNERSADQFHSGKNSRLIETHAIGPQGIKQIVEDLTIGKQYNVLAWIYPEKTGQYSVGLGEAAPGDAEELGGSQWQLITREVTYTGESDGVHIVSWDSQDIVFRVDDVSVREAVPNVPPVLFPISDESVEVGSTLEIIVSATDGDNDPLTYNASGMPVGATMNSHSEGAVFTFTPSGNQVASYNVTFSVTDDKDTVSETISLDVVPPPQQTTFYVDVNNGDDNNDGRHTRPYKTLNKALDEVSNRVDSGQISHRIFLRSGVYRNDAVPSNSKLKSFSLYSINMAGTSADPAILSAMPCIADTAGCVQRKSGEWYENVVIDDGYTIPPETTQGTKMWSMYRNEVNHNIWKADPGYLNLQFGESLQDPPVDTFSWASGTNSNELAIGPRMLLQDGVPLVWADPWPDYNPLDYNPPEYPYVEFPRVAPEEVLTEPGMHTYDQVTGTLYIWPFNNADPGNVLMESWKGTTIDCRFRHVFDSDKGNPDINPIKENIHIKGIEFRLALHVINSNAASDALAETNFRNLTIEDNVFSYCWTHFFQDNPDYMAHVIPRVGWTLRYNVFYRPIREVFQIYGNDHVFEYNEIIEHSGPWAGGVAGYGALNMRHMNNTLIRNNYINHIGTKWHEGTCIMFEINQKQIDKNNLPNCLYGNNTTIEHNFLGDMDGGGAILLGKGGCRLRNITIRNNVFAINRGRGESGIAISMKAPYENLQIHNNVFYDQRKVFNLSYWDKDIPNDITIYDNIFLNNKGRAVITSEEQNEVTDKTTEDFFYNNVFFSDPDLPNNDIEPLSIGDRFKLEDPRCKDPINFNFTLKSGSSAIQQGPDIGAYDFGSPVPYGTTDWWNMGKKYYVATYTPGTTLAATSLDSLSTVDTVYSTEGRTEGVSTNAEDHIFLKSKTSCIICHIETDMSNSELPQKHDIYNPIDTELNKTDTCLTGCHTVEEACHPVNVIPYRAFPPADLPLGNNGEITCLTCHYTHGSSESKKPYVAEGIISRIFSLGASYKTYYLRRSYSDGELCYACHMDM